MFCRKKLSYIMLPFLLASIGLFFVLAVQASSVHSPTATTHTVCASGCDFSSIQAAINAAGPGDTLSLAGETFTEPFTLDKSLTIEGAGAQNTILQAAAAPGIASSRVITVTEGVTATITGVTIRYGNIFGGYPEGYGGGIFNNGALTLDLSTVISSTARYGGGIYNHTALTLTNSSIISNTADRGGGIYSYNKLGGLIIANSIFEGNRGFMEGGGIYNGGTAILDVSDSTFKNNIAEDGGGITNYKAILTVTNCTFDSNIGAVPGNPPADGNVGGAIWNSHADSLVTIKDSYFYNNDAYTGGAIRNEQNADLVIVGTEFRMNGRHAQGSGGISNVNRGSFVHVRESLFAENRGTIGGAIGNGDYGRLFITDTTFYSNTCSLYGGGIYNTAYAKAFIARTTFESNHADAGGAIYNRTGVEVEVTNSTFSGNVAEQSGGAMGLDNVSTVTATNVTISGNSATDSGGGVDVNYFSVLNLNSSIVAGSLSGGDCTYETGGTFGTVIDLGYNIIEDGTCIYESTSFAGDPQLGPLQHNGGDTDTQALLEGSPAIDAIPTGSCAVTEDQRSVNRPQGVACDIGAFEVVQPHIFLPLVVNK